MFLERLVGGQSQDRRGMLSQGPGWRWVLFVNLPVCALILVGAYRLVPGGRPARSSGVDVPGAVLATVGMLLLVYALVRAQRETPRRPARMSFPFSRTVASRTVASIVPLRFPLLPEGGCSAATCPMPVARSTEIILSRGTRHLPERRVG